LIAAAATDYASTASAPYARATLMMRHAMMPDAYAMMPILRDLRGMPRSVKSAARRYVMSAASMI